MAGAASTKPRGQVGLHFRFREGAPFTVAGLGKLIERAGVAAKIGFKVHLHTAKTIPPAVVASALRSSAGANKHEFGAHTDPDAPLHLALAGQSIALSSWRRRRVQLLATNKHASAVMRTLRPGGPDGGWSRQCRHGCGSMRRGLAPRRAKAFRAVRLAGRHSSERSGRWNRAPPSPR